MWRSWRCPVIAAITGPCLGGGLQIALGADLRIVAPDAKLSVLEIRWGLIPDMTGTWVLPRLVGTTWPRSSPGPAAWCRAPRRCASGCATRVADDPRPRPWRWRRRSPARRRIAIRHAKRAARALGRARPHRSPSSSSTSAHDGLAHRHARPTSRRSPPTSRSATRRSPTRLTSSATRSTGRLATITIDRRPMRRNAASTRGARRRVAPGPRRGGPRSAGDEPCERSILSGQGGCSAPAPTCPTPEEIGPAHDDGGPRGAAGWWWPIVRSPKPFIAAVDGAGHRHGGRAHVTLRLAHRVEPGAVLVELRASGAGARHRRRHLAAAAPGRPGQRPAASCFGGEPVRAETAKNMGYVHVVVEPEALRRTCG